MRTTILVAVFAGACRPSPNSSNDAGAPDANVRDAGLPDANVPDANVPDANIPDASVPDANIPDANIPDASVPDAAVSDAGATDAAASTGIIFHSDWGTALGTTADAFRDTAQTDPWDFHCCASNTNTSIVTAPSLGLLGWPAPNVYRVGTLASSPNAIPTHVVEVDLGPPPADSHRYFRYYLQVRHGDAHGNGTSGNYEHGIETAETGGGDGFSFFRIPRSNGTWFPGWSEVSSGWRYVGDTLNLLKNHTYRMEWHLAYGMATYTVEIRITDETTGTVVATENDFHRWLPSPEDMNARLGGVQFTYTPTDHQLFRVGTNGPSSNFPMVNLVDQDLFLHGAVAISNAGWVGPYANGI